MRCNEMNFRALFLNNPYWGGRKFTISIPSGKRSHGSLEHPHWSIGNTSSFVIHFLLAMLVYGSVLPLFFQLIFNIDAKSNLKSETTQKKIPKHIYTLISTKANSSINSRKTHLEKKFNMRVPPKSPQISIPQSQAQTPWVHENRLSFP